MTPPAATLDTDREAFRDLAGGDDPVVVHVAADLDVDASPLAAYAALRDGDDHAFLLESAGKTASSDPDGAFRPDDAAEERHARYSFVGYDPEAVVTVGPEGTAVERLGGLSDAADYVAPAGDDPAGEGDVLDRLRGALPAIERRNFPAADRQLLAGGLVGFVAYDAVYDLWLEEVGVERPPPRVPDAEFVLATSTLQFDHAADAVTLALTPVVGPDTDPDALYDALVAEAERVADVLADATPPGTGGFAVHEERADPRADYEAAVERAIEHVYDGDVYQGVLSRERQLVGDVDVLGLYAAMRAVNPSPYMYVLEHGPRAIVGASPETLVSVRDGEVLMNPIAGTCERGASPVEDRRLAGEMLADEKERAEHTMLVDLARNDVRRVSRPGSVRVEEFMSVLKYSHVQHIESTVTGRLAPDADAFDAVRAAFPAGTLAGAPKIRAMEIIDALEARPRGVYGGGVGYVSWTGDADTAIVIRTATVERDAAGAGAEGGPADHPPAFGEAVDPADLPEGARDVVTVRAGAGVVADSDPAAEYRETEDKMGGVLDAIERIRTDPEDAVDRSGPPPDAPPTEPEAER